MSTLYQRYRPVFANGVSGGSIVNLKIRWTVKNKTNTAPELSLDPGETKLQSVVQSGTLYTLNFVARHPLLESVYYATAVEIETVVPETVVYTVLDGVYMVQANTPGGAAMRYTLADDSGITKTLDLSVQTVDTVLLADFSGGITWPAAGSIVEPFNVIFDYLSDSVNTVVPTITDGVSSIPISGALFTNTPIISSGGYIRRPVAVHTFELNENILSIAGNAQETSNSKHIRSINGVVPTEGNITIKFLP